MIPKETITENYEHEAETAKFSTNTSIIPEKLSDTDKEKYNARKSIYILLIIFIISIIIMIYIYMMFPKLNEDEKQYLKIPYSIEDAKMLGKVLDQYKNVYYFEVMFGVILVYIFLQTFAIPGSLFLSILSGFLFDFPIALTLVCFCSALGASLCYLLSHLVGRRLVRYYLPERAMEWTKEVNNHRSNLLFYMLFLRITPFLPNWFINLVAPVIGVPLLPFAVGTFFGVAAPSCVAIQAGRTLNSMTSTTNTFSWQSMLILTILAVFSLIPVIFKKQFKKKIE